MMVDDKLLPNVLRGDAATLRLNSTQFNDIAKNLDQAAAALSALPPPGETGELVKQLHHVAHNMAVKLPMTSTERIIIEKAAAALQRREEDGERLDWLDSLNGRRHCGPSGHVSPLNTDIHVGSRFSIFLRDQCGQNATTGSGATMREAIDAARKKATE